MDGDGGREGDNGVRHDVGGHHVVPALHLVHQIAVQDGEDGGRKAVELPVLPGGFHGQGIDVHPHGLFRAQQQGRDR